MYQRLQKTGKKWMTRIVCVWIPGGVCEGFPESELFQGISKDGISKETGKDTRSAGRQAWKTQDEMFQLARWANRYSPLVGFPELVDWKRELTAQENRKSGKQVGTQYAHPPDARAEAWKTEALWMDITDSSRYFGTTCELVQRIIEDGTGLGLRMRVAAANTVAASWAACLYLAGNEPRVLPTAQDAVREVLGQLPVNCLRLPDTALDALMRLGIVTLGQLLSLPQEAVVQRLGDQVIRRCAQLFGDCPEPLKIVQPLKRYGAERVLPGPMGGSQVMTRLFEQLLTPLLKQLEHEGRGVLQLKCDMEVSRFGQRIYSDIVNTEKETEQLTIGLYRPTLERDHLVSLFEMEWEKIGRVDEMYRFELEVTQTAIMQQRQQNLFSDCQCDFSATAGTKVAPRLFARLIDRLTSRLGNEQVKRPQLIAEAQPELCYEMQPIVELDMRRWCRHALRPDDIRRKSPEQHQAEPTAHRQRPGWVLGNKPLSDARPLWHWVNPLEISCRTTHRSGSPCGIYHRGQWREILRFWGPERIETGWWRTRAIRREYYRIEITSGQRFWVFRQLPTQQWYLQGDFG